MTGSDADLIHLLVSYGLTPSLVLALLIAGYLVTKKQYDEAVKAGNEWRQLYLDERETGRRRDEMLTQMSATMARVLEEVQRWNARANR